MLLGNLGYSQLLCRISFYKHKINYIDKNIIYRIPIFVDFWDTQEHYLLQCPCTIVKVSIKNNRKHGKILIIMILQESTHEILMKTRTDLHCLNIVHLCSCYDLHLVKLDNTYLLNYIKCNLMEKSKQTTIYILHVVSNK